jgi:NitT/TauT family transport system ATP-binding protein
VQEDLTVDLPAERDQLSTRSDPRFTKLRGHVYEQIQKAKTGT